MSDQDPRITIDTQPTKKTRPAWVVFAFELLQTIVMALVLYFLIDSVVARVRVDNISMQPTLQPGNFILVNKLAYRLDKPDYGDVVIFHFPLNPQEDYIKRIIGLPGDTVRVDDGMVFVNGQPLRESYISDEPLYSNEWQVPERHIFVLGDNRNQSSDSHSWGFVPMENVIGKALVVYWPLEEIKTLSEPIVVRAQN